MSAGMYLSRHAGHLAETFRVSADYMPRDASLDPYASTAQWSRRFIGLKLWMSLAVAGWDGYAAALREEVALAVALRARLTASGWIVANDTPLPVVCFVDATRDDVRSGPFLDAIARAVAASAHAWISLTRLANSGRVLVIKILLENRDSRDGLHAMHVNGHNLALAVFGFHTHG